MKVFSATQIRACDAYTIHASGIASAELMERAAAKCNDWIGSNFGKETLFVVLCGMGNNGGDGLALTRMLCMAGYGAKAFILQIGDEYTPDSKLNLERLQRIDGGLVTIVQRDTFITDIPANIVIVDAIFGTGLNRPLQGWPGAFIHRINELPNRKIAIDIPSGLPADSVPAPDAAIIKAGDTLSFQFYKRTFFHPETGVFAGNIHILDIGLDKTFIASTGSQYNVTSEDDVKAIYHPRTPFSHKGTYGNVLMIGGSYGKTGAITLSSKAALRAGAGLVSALVPECGYNIIQTAVPEVMCRTSGQKYIEKIEDWEHTKAIGIGPGMDTQKITAKAFETFIDSCKQPIVVDADALNLLSMQPDLLAKIPAGSVLTPHPKEFTRLFGDSINSMMQLEHARTQAMRYNINIVLKGHYTAVVNTEGDCWYNITGNAGMATGGAGDVLTGIITGLLAQGYEPHHAAMLGVYLHGLAGDIAAKELSEEALIAGDIIEYLGKAFLTIQA